MRARREGVAVDTQESRKGRRQEEVEDVCFTSGRFLSRRTPSRLSQVLKLLCRANTFCFVLSPTTTKRIYLTTHTTPSRFLSYVSSHFAITPPTTSHKSIKQPPPSSLTGIRISGALTLFPSPGQGRQKAAAASSFVNPHVPIPSLLNTTSTHTTFPHSVQEALKPRCE